MKYINSKTGAVLETASVIRGGNWVPVEEKQPKKTTETPVKKTTKKRGE